MTDTIALNPRQKKLVEDHIWVARVEARKIYNRASRFHQYEDLESIAYIGLCKAALRWDAYCEQNGYSPDRIEYFQPFAQRRCAGEILDTIRAQSHVPRSVTDRAKIIREAGYNDGKSIEQVMATTGLSRSVIQETMAGLTNITVYIDEDMENALTYDDVETSVIASMVRTTVVQVIQSLPASHQAILALKYHSHFELRDIARALHISESRASVAHTEAVLEIHQAVEAALKDTA